MTDDKKSEEEWVMSGPSERKVSDFLMGDSEQDLSFDDEEFDDPSLEAELANWGMDIPPVLSDKSDNEEFSLDIPEIIENDSDYLIESDSPGASEDVELTELDELENRSFDLSESEVNSQTNNKTESDDVKKVSILDHLGKNFFDDDEFTSEHSIDDLVKDAEVNESTQEFRSDLSELSTALKGDSEKLHPTKEEDAEGEEEIFPEDSDLEYPDLAEFSSLTQEEATSVDEAVLPDNDDLAYPDLLGEEKGEIELSGEEVLEPTSKLISADELVAEGNQNEEDLEETNPSFNITQEIKDDLTKEIEEDELDPDDFWATDDFPKIKQKLDKPITEVQASKHIKDDFFKSLNTDDEDNFKIIPSKRFSSISLDEVAPPAMAQKQETAFDEKMQEEIVDKVKEALTPALEKIVKDLFSEKIEKIAWEVIPDLAENIIKHEVEEIAKQVYLSKDSNNK